MPVTRETSAATGPAGPKQREFVRTLQVTAQTGKGSTNTNLAEFIGLADDGVREYDYTRLRPERPPVIHAAHDKAHVLGGCWRYTEYG